MLKGKAFARQKGGIMRAIDCFRMHRKPVKYPDFIGKYLTEVYGRYSEAKRRAYVECRGIAIELESEEYGIVSANRNMFVFGLVFRHPKTGQMMYGRITRCSMDCWPIEG